MERNLRLKDLLNVYRLSSLKKLIQNIFIRFYVLRKYFAKSIKSEQTLYSDIVFFVKKNKGKIKRFGKDIVIIIIDDVQYHLRKNTSDFQVFRQIIICEEYKEVLDSISYEKRNPIIINAGANIGMTDLYIKTRIPEARIFSFEPEGKNFEVLNSNIVNNHFNDIFHHQKGIWSTIAFLEVDKKFRDGKEWSFSVKASGKETALQGVSINDICERYHLNEIDFLKMDIEGSEFEIFEDGANYNQWLNKVQLMSLEIHAEKGNKETLIKKIISHKFSHSSSGELEIFKRI